MAEFKLNFSCEEFIPSKKCFFIKRISNVDDDTFLYYLEFYLDKYKFDGVVYVGEEIGGVLEEYFTQELWEKSVMMKVPVIGFYLVGEGVNIQDPVFKDRYLFIQNCKTYRIESKAVTFNPQAHPCDSEKAIKTLENMVKTLVKNANEKAGEWYPLFSWLNSKKLYNGWIGKKKERRKEKLLKKIANCLGKYKKYAIIGPIAIILEVVLEVYIPYVLGKLIDEGADKIAIYGMGYIYKIGLFLLALTILSLCCGALSGYASSVAGTGLAKNLRTTLFDKISSFSFNNIDKFSTSSLITRLTVDINNTQMAFMMILRICFRAPFMLISATIMAFTINRDVAWIFLVTIPVLGGALLAIVVAAFPKFQKMLGYYDVMNRDLQENLIGIRAVKAYVRESDQIDKFEDTSKKVCWAQIQAEKIVAMNGPIMQTIVGLTLASVLFLGGKQIIIGKMDAGMIMTFVTYGMQILMSLMMLSMVVVTLVLSKASVTRICEVLDEKIDVQDTEEAIKKDLKVKDGSIEFKNVSFKYSFHIKSSEENTKEYEEKLKQEKYNKRHKLENQIDLFTKAAEHFKNAVEKVTNNGESKTKKATSTDDNYVLTDINLKIKSGETIGVIGGTGSSKTTFISMIPRLYDVTKGKVLVGGVDVKEYTKKNLRDAVAVVLQKNVLFSGTIKDNLLWGNENATDEEIIAAAKIANAHEFVSESIDGYNTELGQGGVNVSGGQKQRLTIARALLKNPKVLILDDSMSAVDTKTDASIRRALKTYQPDITKIIIAQRISSIYDADKILVLDDGKISGFGTHDELLKTNEIYKEIYNSQAEGGVK